MDKERIAKAKDWVKRQHDSSAWLIVNAKEHDLSAKDIASAEESYRVTAALLLLLDEAAQIKPEPYNPPLSGQGLISEADEGTLGILDAGCRDHFQDLTMAQRDALLHLHARLAAGGPKADDKFIAHIQSHLKPGREVVCKICGRTAKEICGEKPAPPEGDEERKEMVKAIDDALYNAEHWDDPSQEFLRGLRNARARILQPKATVTRRDLEAVICSCAYGLISWRVSVISDWLNSLGVVVTDEEKDNG